MKVYQSRSFAKTVKKFEKNQKLELDTEIKKIIHPLDKRFIVARVTLLSIFVLQLLGLFGCISNPNLILQKNYFEELLNTLFFVFFIYKYACEIAIFKNVSYGYFLFIIQHMHFILFFVPFKLEMHS